MGNLRESRAEGSIRVVNPSNEILIFREKFEMEPDGEVSYKSVFQNTPAKIHVNVFDGPSESEEFEALTRDDQVHIFIKADTIDIALVEQ